MKAIFPLLAMVLLTVSFPVCPAEACWVGFSTEELVEQSDLIVLGDIKGISGTEKVEGTWKTYWEVEVQYFLKGDADSSLLIVATPGAKNKQPLVSTHYHLNEWGDTVLLFLAKRKAYFEPLSPQGVVALSPIDPPLQGIVAPNLSNSPPQNQLSGEYLMKKYNIVDEKMPEEDKKELENYVAGLSRVAAVTSEVDNEGMKDENHTKQSSSLGIIGGADGPTSIYVTGNPLKTMISRVITAAAIIFAGGFVLGYLIKARRSE